jgi:hypothetical protein
MSYHVNPIARTLPRLGARSVGDVPKMATPVRTFTPAELIAKARAKLAGGNPLAVEYFDTCYKVPAPDGSLNTALLNCSKDAAPLKVLSPDGSAFYRTCLAARTPDVPLRVQHGACLAEAQKIVSSSDASSSMPVDTVPVFAPPPEQSSGLPGGKWLWIAGAAGAAALAFVLLKPAKN